jgi:hypothetical protein
MSWEGFGVFRPRRPLAAGIGACGARSWPAAWSAAAAASGTRSCNIFAQRYNAAGVPQCGEFRVNSVITDHQRFPAIAMDADSGFVVGGIVSVRTAAAMASTPRSTTSAQPRSFPRCSTTANHRATSRRATSTIPGNVNVNDFNILASRFGTVLAPASVVGRASSALPPTGIGRTIGLSDVQRDVLRALLN